MYSYTLTRQENRIETIETIKTIQNTIHKKYTQNIHDDNYRRIWKTREKNDMLKYDCKKRGTRY
jgi:hypothetical protein